MKIVEEPGRMRQIARAARLAGRRIGLVPTMGCLHEGHLSLIRIAREQADFRVISLFVNPTQFGPGDDYDRYPQARERDERLCREAGVDILFRPSAARMYAPDASVRVVETRLSRGLCGASRPGHFQGVCTVVAKLFHLCDPDLAVFGLKDAQQLRIIERMVRDLDFPVEILRAPVVREPDGLAMSSRNGRLSPEHRRQAVCLRRALDAAEALAAGGQRRAAALAEAMEREIRAAPDARREYAEVVDDETLEPVVEIRRPALAALAVRFGDVRLIDNAWIPEPPSSIPGNGSGARNGGRSRGTMETLDS